MRQRREYPDEREKQRERERLAIDGPSVPFDTTARLLEANHIPQTPNYRSCEQTESGVDTIPPSITRACVWCSSKWFSFYHVDRNA